MIIFRSAAEARHQLHRQIPRLVNAKWLIKSPCDTGYQCIAWAACRTDRVWWPWDHPRFYWPPGFAKLPVNSPVPVESFVEMFELRFGYGVCQDTSFQLGFQKVAIYANALGVTHMARQRLFRDGWLSKLGDAEDILHPTLGDVVGDISPMAQEYGTVAVVLRRSWWTAASKFCLFRCGWAGMKFAFYRKIIPWDLT